MAPVRSIVPLASHAQQTFTFPPHSVSKTMEFSLTVLFAFYFPGSAAPSQWHLYEPVLQFLENEVGLELVFFKDNGVPEKLWQKLAANALQNAQLAMLPQHVWSKVRGRAPSVRVAQRSCRCWTGIPGCVPWPTASPRRVSMAQKRLVQDVSPHAYLLYGATSSNLDIVAFEL